MYNKIKLNSKNYNQENNSIFKQINTNIITDYQKNMYLSELNQNQQNSALQKNRIPSNQNQNICLNGTADLEYNFNFIQMQRTKFNNNKINYNTNTNKNNKTKQALNRYNSYGRMNTNLNNNNAYNHNQNSNRPLSKNKKVMNNHNNNPRYNKMQSNNNSRGHNNTQINNQRTPLNSKKKSFIPLGNTKYKTIGDTNYSNYGNKMYNEANRTFIQRPEHNTIDLNNLYSNNQNNINRKYNMKRPPNNINHNYYYNYNTNTNNNRQHNHKNSNYNFKNIELTKRRKNGVNSRPKTPDFNKRGKSSSRFNTNNQRAKTPDRNRSKMRLNLNKEYLNTTDNKPNKKINHYNYSNRDYNYTIDNASNNGKYKYNNQMNRLNTNDYFKLHKKTINNYYDYKDTINANNTITSNNSNSRRYSYGKINNNNNNQKKNPKRLSKNCSQGNILGQNNYNINLNSNGINYVHKNVNDNNYNHYHSNTNLVTPIKYMNQKSNFKGQVVQMTQLRPPNNYNIYDETFQSFGTNLPSSINNDINKKNYNQNKIINIKNEINDRNYLDILNNNKKDKKYNNCNKYQRYILQNDNEMEDLNYELTRQKTGNYNNNNTYIPATINNIANKTYSYFNNKKDKIINQKENINNNDIQDINEKIDIDFNDLDQFSPPYSKEQVNLTNNIDKDINKNNNKYINIGSLQDNNYNYKYNKINYDMDFNRQKYDYDTNLYLKDDKIGNNRKAINDFILQLKAKF